MFVEFPAEWFLVILILCFFQLHTNIALNLYQVKREPKKYGIFSIILTTLKNVLMLLFVIQYDMKWEGMILGYTFGYGLFFFISLFIFKHHKLFTAEIKKDYLIDNIKVGTPLSLHQIGSWLASSSTRIIVSGLLGAAATGSFGIGATIGMIVLFIQDSFNKAFVPYLFENLNNFNTKVEKKLIKLTFAYNVILFLFAFVIGLFGYLFLEVIFGSAYAEGKEVVYLICFAYAFDGMYKMHVNYIFYTKKTHFIFFITMTTGLLNIVLSYLFINMYGLMGGALSLCVINFIGYLLSWYIGNRVYPMKWIRMAV
jgi:O-antigen/teichoic acid export membrane protein